MKKAMFSIAVLLALQNLVYSFIDMRTYPGYDLWQIIYASRLWLAGKNPYALAANATTHTPFVILLYAPFCYIPYAMQRVMWWMLEWTALMGSMALLAWSEKDKSLPDLFIILALTFFVGSRFWRLHTELGQRYVYLLFMEVLAYTTPLGEWMIGPLLLWRPIYLVMLPIFWMTGQKRLVEKALTLAGWLFTATFPFIGFLWRDWFSTSSGYALGEASFAPAGLFKLTPFYMDGVNTQRFLGSLRYMETLNMTFLHTMHFRLMKPFARHWNVIWINNLLLGVCVIVFLWATKQKGPVSRRMAYLSAFTLCAVTDMFVPARYGYADILLLLPIFLALPYLEETSWYWTALGLGGLCFGHSLLTNTDSGSLFTILRSPLIVAGLAGLVLTFRTGSSLPPTHQTSEKVSTLTETEL